MKVKSLQLISLSAAFAACLGGAAFSAGMMPDRVFADTTSVTSVFTTANSAAGIATSDVDHLEFSFTGQDEKSFIEYRKNLAYKWYWNEENGDAYKPGWNYFSTEFSFKDQVNFDEFTLTFNSAENSVTNQKLATNKIVFTKNSVTIGEGAAEQLTLSAGATVKVSFSEPEGKEERETARANGEYIVTVTVGRHSIKGTFTNIAGTYAKYTAPNATLRFSASVADGKDQKVDFLSLNGQKFDLVDSGVEAIAPSVLCVNGDVKQFTLGATALDFDYLGVNVIAKSGVTTSVKYYQYSSKDEAPSYKTLSSTAVFYDSDEYEANGDKEYISVQFTVSMSGTTSTEYYLADYALDDSKIVQKNGVEYIVAALDDNAPVYNDMTTAVGGVQTFDYNCPAYLEYQEAVAAVEGLQAGSGHYFYLPSLYALISDGETAYNGLKFTIYYRSSANESTNTSSNLAAKDLKIPTASAGEYEFKVVATDKSGNAMDLRDKLGKKVTVSTSNVWELDQVPSFRFSVSNQGISIETQDELDQAYENRNYKIDKLEVKGTVGTTKHELYYVKELPVPSYKVAVEFTKAVQEGKVTDVTDDNFLEKMAEWYKDTYDKQEEYDAQWTLIPHWDSDGPTDEEDDEWATHGNRYEWKESSMSFTPRETEGYYVVSYLIKDSERIGERVYAFQVIEVQPKNDSIDAFSLGTWIENHTVTFVFIVIAALSLVAIVVLLLIKPSDETVEGGKKKEKFVKKDRKGERK